jgi:transcriptional regulator with XRE-family HTH domain
MQPIEEFTNRIKSLREDSDLLQKEVAEYLEITQQQYSLYEKGIRLMPMDMVKKLARYYNVDMNYIAGISNIRKPYPKDELKRPL